MQFDLTLDYETYSESDISTGADRYALGPDAGAWCAGLSLREEGRLWGEPVVSILTPGEAGRDAVETALRERNLHVVSVEQFRHIFQHARRRYAHNAGFERAITKRVVGIDTPVESWSCTAARSSRMGLPASLEGVMEALGSPIPKDMVGNALAKKMGKPRPTWKKAGTGRKWFDSFENVVRTAEYCISDIRSQCWLDSQIPELEPLEHQRWCSQVLENEFGLNIDWDLVDTMSQVVSEYTKPLEAAVYRVTEGRVRTLNQQREIVAWAWSRGVPIPNIAAETVTRFLAEMPGMDPAVRFVLESRAAAKASTAKLVALRDRRKPDGRVGDMLKYGAARTLRTTGSGPQPLNLPRPGDVDVGAALAALKQRSWEQLVAAVSKDARSRVAGEHAGVKTIKGARSSITPPEAVSACLRATIVPSRGKAFYAVDYSGVESAATFALSGQYDACDAIRRGVDQYCVLAGEVYGYEVRKKDHPTERQLGKAGVLGLGFGLSNPETFMEYCANTGLYITEALANKTIQTFKRKFPIVESYRNDLHRAAMDAVWRPGTWQWEPRGRVSYRYHSDRMLLEAWLPSRRSLWYPGARIGEGKFGPALLIKSWKNKKWVDQTLTKQVAIENVIQAICRDMMEEHKAQLIREGRVRVVYTCYDEILAEVDPADAGVMGYMEGVMSQVPEWFPDMPLKNEGWGELGYYYRK